MVIRRIQKLPPGPLMLGYSGGGDSHALMRLAAASGRDVRAIIIDHALRETSASEAEQARQTAEASGVPARLMRWNANKPATGIQAAAREFRLKCYAAEARRNGVRTVMLGHTADDQAETVWMRIASGGGIPALAAMPQSSALPIWPEGRGMCIARPLITARRQDLRDWLVRRGDTWIEDPSNESRRFSRIRARQALGQLEQRGVGPTRLISLAHMVEAWRQQELKAARQRLQRDFEFLPWGGARILSGRVPARSMQAVMAAIAGTADIPLPDARQLVSSLEQERAATSAGCALTQHNGSWFLVRDPGAVLGGKTRSGIVRQTELDECRVWDGRYAAPAGRELELLGEDYEGLTDKSVLKDVPALARSGLFCVREKGTVAAIAGVTGENHTEMCYIGPELAQRLLYQGQDLPKQA